MQIAIEKLQAHDIIQFIELIQLFEEVFEMENFSLPPEPHLHALLAKDDFFVFVAIHNGRIVGGLTTYTLQQYYGESPIAYIYDLAVDANFQRQGIGKKLIIAVTAFCTAKGFREVFVQAEEADADALEFYRSTGAIEEKVRHFNYHLNKR